MATLERDQESGNEHGTDSISEWIRSWIIIQLAPLQHFFFLIQIFFYSFKVDSSEHIFMPAMEKALVNFPETQYLHELYFQFKDFFILLKLNLLSRYYIYASHGKSTCKLLWNSVFTKMTFLILLIAQTHTSISNTLVMQIRAS